MGRLRGSQRQVGNDPRARRNASALSLNFQLAGGDGALAQDPTTGEITLSLGTLSGLSQTGGALNVVVQGVLAIDASGVTLTLGQGVEDASGALQVQVKTDGGIVRDADGLSVNAATATVRGGVKQLAAIADQGVLTDSSGGTSGGSTVGAIGITVIDPVDTPADAAVLRDDLVTNTIPDIEARLSECRNAIATLAAYATSLEDKVNEILAKARTAEVLGT